MKDQDGTLHEGELVNCGIPLQLLPFSFLAGKGCRFARQITNTGGQDANQAGCFDYLSFWKICCELRCIVHTLKNLATWKLAHERISIMESQELLVCHCM